MALYNDMREFLRALEEKGLLKRVKAEVSADLEIPEILDRLVKKNGPAVIFENVKGFSGGMPVAGNPYGTRERGAMGLGGGGGGVKKRGGVIDCLQRAK